jgi:hypothetical protein
MGYVFFAIMQKPQSFPCGFFAVETALPTVVRLGE